MRSIADWDQVTPLVYLSLEASLQAICFCMPEFPEIGERYASLAYFVPFLNSPLQEIIK